MRVSNPRTQERHFRDNLSMLGKDKMRQTSEERYGASRSPRGPSRPCFSSLNRQGSCVSAVHSATPAPSPSAASCRSSGTPCQTVQLHSSAAQ